jgi:hypothetical protein
VDANDLWWHFGRFAAFVRDLDPAAEGFEPGSVEHPRLRVYTLEGTQTLLVWCRDKQNTWQTELRDQRPPQPVTGAVIRLTALPRAAVIRAYDPWENRWTDLSAAGAALTLPRFSRSIALRITLKE